MTTPSDPISILETMHSLVNAGDLDGVLGYFADDAVIRNLPLPDPPDMNIHTGLQEIREWFEPQLQQHLYVTSKNYQTTGDTTTFDSTITDDELQAMGVGTLDTMVEVIMKSGKITSFNLTFTPESIRKLEAAEEQSGESV